MGRLSCVNGQTQTDPSTGRGASRQEEGAQTEEGATRITHLQNLGQAIASKTVISRSRVSPASSQPCRTTFDLFTSLSAQQPGWCFHAASVSSGSGQKLLYGLRTRYSSASQKAQRRYVGKSVRLSSRQFLGQGRQSRRGCIEGCLTADSWIVTRKSTRQPTPPDFTAHCSRQFRTTCGFLFGRAGEPHCPSASARSGRRSSMRWSTGILAASPNMHPLANCC